MKNKWKIVMIFFLIAAVFFLEPVSYVLASDTTSGTEEGYDRTMGIPRLNSSEIKFEKHYFWDWFGLKNVPVEECIEGLVLSHRKLENVDYSLYDLVCDFELKTFVDGGSINTSYFTYTIDFSGYKFGWAFDLLVDSLKDSLVINDYSTLDYSTFQHSFDYGAILENAEGFEKEDLTGDENYYTYNTVISRVDFYFVRKSDGEKGEARRFIFTWGNDFWMQKCTKIEFAWFDHDTGIDKEIGYVEDFYGVDGYGEDESSTLDTLYTILNVPLVLLRFVTGFLFFFGDSFSVLVSCVFPFIPPSLISIIVGFIVAIFIIRVASYFLFKR